MNVRRIAAFIRSSLSEIYYTIPRNAKKVKKMAEKIPSKGEKRKLKTLEGNDDETSSSSKISKRRNHPSAKPSPMHMRFAKKAASDAFNRDETDYYFENGFRKVYPYFFSYQTFCKRRWLGLTIRELYTNEFQYYTIDHYEHARKTGNLLLNLKPLDSLDIILKDNDMLTSRLHRHECCVTDDKIEIVVDDSKYLVVNKPSSIPIHPCGRYRNNTLVYILKREFGYEKLHSCHRIDRLTSGIVVFAKTKHIAAKTISEIRDRKVEKEYICKVVGEFPTTEDEGIVCDQPVTLFNPKLGCSVAWEVDGFTAKESSTEFHRLSTDGETSIVLCKPKTGRTHQIRVHLQYLGYPIVNDPLYNNPAWGEERFHLGPCKRDVFEVTDAIAQSHTYWKSQIKKDLFLSEENKSTNDVTTEAGESATETPENNLKKPETPESSKHFSLDCLECLNPMPEPDKQWMVMYLHAYKYKGSDWEFKTEMPEWAK